MTSLISLALRRFECSIFGKYCRAILRPIALALLLSAGLAGPVRGDAYPSRVVKFIVPNTTGGPVDTTARLLADQLKNVWRQPVVVENRPGAGGNLGADTVAKAAPDGNTLLFTASLVSTAVPDDELEAYTLKLADEIASRHPATLAAAKIAVQMGSELGVADAMKMDQLVWTWQRMSLDPAGDIESYLRSQHRHHNRGVPEQHFARPWGAARVRRPSSY